MATTSTRAYRRLRVGGTVSVERVNKISDSDMESRKFWVILLMGPTGAGKSTFIEALGLEGFERISSNRLEESTQTISTYKINNVIVGDGNPVYLVDSPGFADTKISEMAIVAMLQKWRKDNGGQYFDRILFLTPITCARFPASHRQLLKTFQALTGVDAAKSITVITTMWDAIEGERARTRAEGIYKQLENDVWKEFVEQGAGMTKFYNTQDSAMLVLDEAFCKSSGTYFNVENEDGTPLQHTPFATNLYAHLQDRIEKLQLEIPNIQSDLAHTEAHDDQQLQTVLRPQLEEAVKLLEKFRGELQEFGLPPVGIDRLHLVAEPALSHGNGEADSKVRTHVEMGAPVEGILGSHGPIARNSGL